MILWRYLISSYVKVFFLAIVSFIAILLLTRLQEIAKFMTLGAHFPLPLLFIAYQIPYILPIAMAIASLLAAFTLFYRLSLTQELTTLRASALSLRFIASPLLLLAILLSFANFYLCSELAPTSTLKSRMLISNLTSADLFRVLSHNALSTLNTNYIHLEPLQDSPTTYRGTIAFYHKNTERIQFLFADAMTMKEGQIQANHLTLVGSLPESHALFIENHNQAYSSLQDLFGLLHPKRVRIGNEALTLPLVRLQKKELRRQKNVAETDKERSSLAQKMRKCDAELVQRMSLGLAPFTFTLLGIAFGMHIGRKPSRKNLLIVTIMTLVTLLAFFAGRELSSYVLLGSILLLGPHCLLILLSMRAFTRIRRGIL